MPCLGGFLRPCHCWSRPPRREEGAASALYFVHLSKAICTGWPHRRMRSNVRSMPSSLAQEDKQRGYQAYALHLLVRSPRITNLRRSSRPKITTARPSPGEELGMRSLLAHCHRGLGLYAATRRREEARAELAAAIALYRAMEMTSGFPRRRRRWCRWKRTLRDTEAILPDGFARKRELRLTQRGLR